jgi:hypothetical protein
VAKPDRFPAYQTRNDRRFERINADDEQPALFRFCRLDCGPRKPCRAFPGQNAPPDTGIGEGHHCFEETGRASGVDHGGVDLEHSAVRMLPALVQ